MWWKKMKQAGIYEQFEYTENSFTKDSMIFLY